MNRLFSKAFAISGLVFSLSTLTGCSTPPTTQATNWPVYKLTAEQVCRLNPPTTEVFEASGLLLTRDGDLLTISDHGPTLYRIQLPAIAGAANLQALTNCFTRAQLASFKPYAGHYDCEGIAQDEQGRVYICEEANRWVLRCDPKQGKTEVLPIDWTPVQEFFSSDRNASFEGIAIGNGKLFVANERSSPVIIVVDLQNLKVEDHFVVIPRTPSFLGMLHYSDLSWYDGKLYVLCRHHRVVLEVDPRTQDILAEYNYRQLEDELGYETRFPTGVMEGLAVNRDYIWLATDNNGLGRKDAPKDNRPSLLKCPRPAQNK